MTKLSKVSELFNVIYGVNLELVNLTQCKNTDKNSIPFVSRAESNNGISAYVEMELDIEPNPCHTLSVAGSGSVLSVFYQSMPYYSGRDLYILVPKREISVIEMFFYAKCINANKYRYNYGRQANKTLKNILIPAQMPEKLNNKILSYYKELEKSISEKPLIDKKIKIEINKWENFGLKELFTIEGSKTTSLLELEEYGAGKRPYVTTQATNNGIHGFYDYYTEEGNVITTDSAVLGYCAYQELPFSASDHVEKLIPKFTMNKYIAMFLVTILNMEQYRYNYGIKCSQTRMRKMHIKLPCKNDKPDWEFMENYIKSLPYSSNLNTALMSSPQC